MRRKTTPRLAVALLLALPASTVAHEIPNDVTVQAFLKPEGRRLNLLVRVPLKAMRDMDFPQRGPGFLDLERASDTLRNAATLWISDAIELYEGETQIAKPTVAASRVSLPSDKSFAAYEQALAHVTGAGLPSNTDVYWDQALLEDRKSVV